MTDLIYIPYGPDHRQEMEALIGVEFDLDKKQYGSNWHRMMIAQETICGITYECYGVPDGRVLVRRTDRYSCISQFRFFPDRKTWDRWWYIDRRQGENDPETGRPYAVAR